MIPYTTYNEGSPLVFLHANGYPPDCYQPLFARLPEHRIFSMRQRPLWEGRSPEEIRDWKPLSDDLLRFIGERKLDMPVAVGHSVGGIALLRAALRAPETFSAIILLDPVLFPPYFIRFYQAARLVNLAHKIHPLVSIAKRRRRVFKNREMLLRGYRNKPVFRYFSDEALEAYVNGITCPREDGSYELCYSPEWEVQIYLTGIWRDMELWRGLKNLQVPLLILRGAETDTFFESAGKLVKKKFSEAQVITIPKSTHLVPLEQPEAVKKEIERFLNR